MKILYILSFILFLTSCSSLQYKDANVSKMQDFELSKSQTIIEGSNTEYRDWWDVQKYTLNIKPDFENKSVSGTVNMMFTIIKQSKDSIIQIDLQQPMRMNKIVQVVKKSNDSKAIKDLTIDKSNYKRIANSYFIDATQLEFKDESIELKFYFEGKPMIAEHAPWDGGWVFTKDDKKRQWMSAAVQGVGASAWFPCKDYLGDEPDQGARITILTKGNLVGIANGQIWETSIVNTEGLNVYNWEVTNPINVYNIIPYIGHYVNFTDIYNGLEGELPLSYWVLDYNKEKARKHFQQAKEMLACFEDWFGPYPFYEDGYKLVESPYLGMEHQSNIAYGNQFKNGYMGGDLSGSGFGLDWDFIIVHESGHEWFGNNISMKDRADMWIHESFTNYSEVLFVECKHGLNAANKYAQGLRRNIANDKPIIADYGINKEGSSDMYYKGSNMIHTIRQWIDNDERFKELLHSLNKRFQHTTITSTEIENHIIKFTNLPLQGLFNQYLRTTKIPVLLTKADEKGISFKWENVVDDFKLQLKTTDGEWIEPTKEWQSLPNKKSISVDPNFYIEQKSL